MPLFLVFRYPSVDPFGEILTGCYWMNSNAETLASAAGVTPITDSDVIPAGVAAATTADECSAAAAAAYTTTGDDSFDWVSFSEDDGCKVWTGFDDPDPSTDGPDYESLNNVVANMAAELSNDGGPFTDGGLQVAPASSCTQSNTSDWQAALSNHTRRDEATANQMAYCREEIGEWQQLFLVTLPSAALPQC